MNDTILLIGAITGAVVAIGGLIGVLASAVKTGAETRQILTQIKKQNEQQLTKQDITNTTLTTNNHGSTAKDKQDETLRQVYRVSAQLKHLHRRVDDLAVVDNDDRKAARYEHERIYRRVDEVDGKVEEHIRDSERRKSKGDSQ